jgi:hypothetical protein
VIWVLLQLLEYSNTAIITSLIHDLAMDGMTFVCSVAKPTEKQAQKASVEADLELCVVENPEAYLVL